MEADYIELTLSQTFYKSKLLASPDFQRRLGDNVGRQAGPFHNFVARRVNDT